MNACAAAVVAWRCLRRTRAQGSTAVDFIGINCLPLELDYCDVEYCINTIADVVVGSITINDILWTSVSKDEVTLLSVPIGSVIQELCPALAPPIIRPQQDILNYGAPVISVQFRFQIVVANAQACSSTLMRMTPGAISRLVRMYSLDYRMTGLTQAEVDPWRAFAHDVSVFSYCIDWSIDLGPPNSGQAAAGETELLFGLPHVPTPVLNFTSAVYGCDSAPTACLCTARGACLWGAHDAGGMRCVDSPSGVSEVPCGACPAQATCSEGGVGGNYGGATAEELCATYKEPCACAGSSHGCSYQETNIGLACLAAGGTVPSQTGCIFCSLSADCSAPTVVKYYPPIDAYFTMGRNFPWLNLTFDRDVFRTSTSGDVVFHCSGFEKPFRVPPEALIADGRVFAIHAMSVPNPSAYADCQLTIGYGAVKDQSGVSYRGLAMGQYPCAFADTQGPQLRRIEPKNGVTVPVKIALKMYFDETVFKDASFALKVVSADNDGEIFMTMDGKSDSVIVDNREVTIDIHLPSRKSVSIVIEPSSLRDSVGNHILGFAAGVYVLHTEYAASPDKEETTLDNLLLWVIIILVFVCLALTLFGYCAYRFSSAKGKLHAVGRTMSKRLGRSFSRTWSGDLNKQDAIDEHRLNRCVETGLVDYLGGLRSAKTLEDLGVAEKEKTGLRNSANASLRAPPLVHGRRPSTEISPYQSELHPMALGNVTEAGRSPRLSAVGSDASGHHKRPIAPNANGEPAVARSPRAGNSPCPGNSPRLGNSLHAASGPSTASKASNRNSLGVIGSAYTPRPMPGMVGHSPRQGGA